MRMEDYLERVVTLPKGSKLIVQGKEYPKVILREFGGLDEEEISRPENRESLVKMQEIALTRCIAGLVDKDENKIIDQKEFPKEADIRKLPMAVIDYLFLELRSLTSGDVVKKSIKCPNTECGKRIEPEIDLNELREEALRGDFSARYVILDRGLLHNGARLKKAMVSPVKGEVRGMLFSKKADLKNFGTTNTEFILNCIEEIDGIPVTIDMVRNMKKADRTQILEAVGNVKSFDVTREFICPYCSEKFNQEVDLLDFLF